MTSQLKFIILCVLIALAATMYSQTSRQQIIDAEKSFAAAVKSQDTSLAKQFLSDSFFFATGVKGLPLQIVPKESWLVFLKEYVTDSLSIDDINVHQYGSTAVALLLCTQKGNFRGEDRSGQFILTDIWIEGDKGWKLAERLSSLPKNPKSAGHK